MSDKRIKIKDKDHFINRIVDQKLNRENRITLQSLADEFEVTKERVRQLKVELKSEIEERYKKRKEFKEPK